MRKKATNMLLVPCKPTTPSELFIIIDLDSFLPQGVRKSVASEDETLHSVACRTFLSMRHGCADFLPRHHEKAKPMLGI